MSFDSLCLLCALCACGGEWQSPIHSISTCPNASRACVVDGVRAYVLNSTLLDEQRIVSRAAKATVYPASPPSQGKTEAVEKMFPCTAHAFKG